VCGGGRQIDDAAFDVGTAILDLDDGALPGRHVGHLCHGAEREGAARRVVAVRIHRSAIRHGLAEELTRVKRGVAAPLACREIGLCRACNPLRGIPMRRLRGMSRRERDT